ncbi:MAG: fatty acid desaturase [Gammaproteobacteria bacterium]
MIDAVVEILSAGGLTQLTPGALVLVGLVVTQITILGVTIYLHRHQAHRALELHPVVSHFFRGWLWLTTGMVTREWVAVHRKHHARCETPDDPHSPQVLGIGTVLWHGAELYKREADRAETLDDYGHCTPNDWLERTVYSRYPGAGIGLLMLVNLILFGAPGLVLWAVQMVWIPFWAAGVINGLGHWWGYRNYETQDASRNISPLGFFIGGEELHSNHHAFPASARFASKWWEFDIGWIWIRLLSLLGLARVKKLAPRPLIVPCKDVIDMDTVRAVVLNRMHVMADYARNVIRPVLRAERAEADTARKNLLRQARCLLTRETSLFDASARRRLDQILEQYSNLRIVYQYRQQLKSVWARRAASHECLLQALQQWCKEAEATGIVALEDFAVRLRGYSLQPA